MIVCPATSYGVLAEVASALSGAQGMLPLGLVGDGSGRVRCRCTGHRRPAPIVRQANPVGHARGARPSCCATGSAARKRPRSSTARSRRRSAAGLRTPDLAANEPGEREANTLLFGSHLLSILRRARSPQPTGA